MSGSVRADFRADVALSTRERDEAVPTRIIVNESQLVLTAEEVTTSVALSEVFDIAQDVPADVPPDATATLTLGFHRGESRETASIECRADQLAKFQLVLFKLILSDVGVAVEQTDAGMETGGSGSQATLHIGSERLRFEMDGDAITMARDDIEEFETTTSAFGEESQQPTVVLYSQRRDQPVQTVVVLPSFRKMNLLGRFLQSSPEAGLETSSDSTPSTVEILLVDDESGDLAVTEMMLHKAEERFTVTTTTSAGEGLKAIEAGSFDCVVSDYDMPGTDGIEFLQQVRTRYPDLPFILFTGQGSETVAKEALLSDVTDYVEKDVGTQQYGILATRIKKALR